jgi:hypothetical protein
MNILSCHQQSLVIAAAHCEISWISVKYLHGAEYDNTLFLGLQASDNVLTLKLWSGGFGLR